MSRWFGLSLLLSATLFGCKKEVPPEAGGAAGGAAGGSGVDVAPTSAIDPAVSALAATFAPGELRVTLVNPGAEPRQALRYDYKPGTTGSLQVKTDSDMGMGMTDPATGQLMELMNIIMPSILFDIEMAAEGVDAENNATLVSKVSAVGVEARPGSMPELIDTLTQQLAFIMGMSTRATLSPTGRLIEQTITPPSTISAELAEAMKMAEQATQTVTLPLPEEPVGLGATWTVMNVTQANALEVFVTQTATLESLEGVVATVRCTVTQDLLRGDGAMMGLPPGSSLEFTLFRSEGAGQIQVDLSQPFVFSGDILVGVQAGFDVTSNGESQSVSMTMRTQTTTSTLP